MLLGVEMMDYLVTGGAAGIAALAAGAAVYFVGRKKIPPPPVPHPLVLDGESQAAGARFEILKEVDGEFLPTGEFFDSSVISPHDAVMQCHERDRGSYAAKLSNQSNKGD